MALDIQSSEEPVAEIQPAVTLRAIVLGLFLVVALDVLAI